MSLIVLFCLVWACHGRRIHNSTAQLGRHLSADNKVSLEDNQTVPSFQPDRHTSGTRIFDQLKVLATFFSPFKVADAFVPSSAGVLASLQPAKLNPRDCQGCTGPLVGLSNPESWHPLGHRVSQSIWNSIDSENDRRKNATNLVAGTFAPDRENQSALKAHVSVEPIKRKARQLKKLLKEIGLLNLLGCGIGIGGALFFFMRRKSRSTGASKDAMKVSVAISAEPIGKVEERYLSVCMDIGQIAEPTRFWNPDGGGEIVGSPSFDFAHRRLENLTAALAPAYLRIGGTEADRAYYQLDGELQKPPPLFRSVLHVTHLEAIGAFARAVGFQVCFTLNAGRGTRDSDGAWTSDHARSLMRFVKQRDLPFSIFELGNEPNAFPVFHEGLTVEPEMYARDIDELARVRDEECAGTYISAPSTAWWPTVGEFPTIALGLRPQFIRNYMGRVVNAAKRLDIVTWHYYPGLSDRSALARYRDTFLALPIAATLAAAASIGRTPWTVTVLLWAVACLLVGLVWLLRWLVRPIKSTTLTSPANLETAAKLGAQAYDTVTSAANALKRPPPQLWLGETGSAQVGGQAGVSGRWAGTLWWLDQLGVLALHGHRVQCRQTLCGHADSYALIDETTFEPFPDYWASLLWKRLLGTEAFAVTMSSHVNNCESTASKGDLRIYCHRPTEQAWRAAGEIADTEALESALKPEGFLLLAINLGSAAREIDLGTGCLVATWLLTAPSPSSRTVTINGTEPTTAPDGSVPDFPGDLAAPAVVPPSSALFALTRDLPIVG